jgi:hypothetical protein
VLIFFSLFGAWLSALFSLPWFRSSSKIRAVFSFWFWSACKFGSCVFPNFLLPQSVTTQALKVNSKSKVFTNYFFSPYNKKCTAYQHVDRFYALGAIPRM